jgi:hypothetical protein
MNVLNAVINTLAVDVAQVKFYKEPIVFHYVMMDMSQLMEYVQDVRTSIVEDVYRATQLNVQNVQSDLYFIIMIALICVPLELIH